MAGDDREHLFRDDAGAAFERASRLEEENRELRAEVEQLRRFGRETPTLSRSLGTPKRPSSQALSATIFALGAAIGVLLAFKVTAQCVRTRTPPPPPPSYLAEGPLTTPPVMLMMNAPVPVPVSSVSSVSPVSSASPAEDDCSILWTYDRAGAKHFKAHCVNGEK